MTARAVKSTLQLDGALAVGSVITPSLSGNVNDWNPTGMSRATWVDVSADSNWQITGIAGGFAGRIMFLRNLYSSANDILLVQNSGSSSAGNRFQTPSQDDFHIVGRGDVVLLYHDGSFWFPLRLLPSTFYRDASFQTFRCGTFAIAATDDINIQSGGDGTGTVLISSGDGGIVQYGLGRARVAEMLKIERSTNDIGAGNTEYVEAGYGALVPSDYEITTDVIVELSADGVMEIT